MSTDDSNSILTALRTAVGGPGDPSARGASALRLRVRLQPAGGSGTKVMPPTYAGQRGPVYVSEQRVVDGEVADCVSLDSVASQGNRLELALAEEIDAGRIRIPTIWVDQAEFGVHSALEFSHRVFDAWIEDALLDGQRFGGDKGPWQAMAASQRRDLTALMTRSPTAIVMGSWASRVKNPQGSARLPRILTSEIVAVGAQEGSRAAGRLDVHHVSAGVRVYEAGDGRITLDPGQAKQDKDKARPFPGERPGAPSSAGYGNVTPGLAPHGGITMQYALQLATISLPALRECRFPQDGARDTERDVAGRLMLGALALRMLALQVEHGYDLRSGCLLVPEEEPTVEFVDRLGHTAAAWPIVGAPTESVLGQAIANGREHGISWEEEDLHLVASDAQLDLLRRSLAEAPPEEV